MIVTLTTTPKLILQESIRRYLFIQAVNTNNAVIYLSYGPGTTSDNAFCELDAGEAISGKIKSAIYAVAASGTQLLRVSESIDEPHQVDRKI